MAEDNMATRLTVLEMRVDGVERAVEDRVDSEWVKDFAKPIQEAIVRVEHHMESLGRTVEGVCETHNKMLLRESARKEKEDEGKTLKAWVARVIAAGSAIAAIVVIMTVILAALDFWLRTKGFR